MLLRSVDDVVEWAADPSPLHRLRFDGLDRTDCGSDWLVIDSRTRHSGICIPPCSADDLAFTLLRREVSLVGVRLFDSVVFDDDGHWWSMLERTTGSIEWFGSSGDS